MFITDVARALLEHKVRFAVVGGYAVALHGAVRGTVDLDVVLALSESNYMAAERALVSIGLRSRLPVGAAEVFQFREEYIANRNLIAWSFYDPADPSRLVDVIITYAGKRLATKRVTVSDVAIPILSKRALVEMKRASGRVQDLIDVEALERLS